MQYLISPLEEQRQSADLLILPYFEEKKKPKAAFPKGKVGQEFFSSLEEDFKGEPSEILFSYLQGETEKKVMLLGLGSKDSYNTRILRKACASAAEFARKKKICSINLFLPDEIDNAGVEAVLDGFSMANYSFDKLKRESIKEKPSFFIEKVSLIGCLEKHKVLIEKHVFLMESVNLTRDLVNSNADDLRPKDLALVANGIAEKHPLVNCSVLGKEELEKEGMGLILAVNRGSEYDPALIILRYFGDPDSSDVTAVVGKGVTFDTGGLNLKPTGGIETMKMDMAGAAAVLGIIQSAASFKMKKNIIGVIASAENAIGSKAYKPGDVYISHSGKSVEITNTDAEGRLVLADAFSYLQKNYSPSRIIDIATLTGGIVVAIGDEASGLFSNNEEMVANFKKAAAITGERVWEMPLFPEYRKSLNSPIADIKNSGSGRKASPCMGAAFLKEFIDKDMPWAHLDIAGTAYLSETSAYYPSYATGVGVKLITCFIENL